MSDLPGWKIAYIIFIVIMLTYIFKFEYEYYYYKQRKFYAKEAKALASHAIMTFKFDPEYSKDVRKIAFLANQADTSKNYKEALDYYNQTQLLYNQMFNLPLGYKGSWNNQLSEPSPSH
jgi:hypothetical protein